MNVQRAVVTGLCVGCLGLAVANGFLFLQNRHLSAELATGKAAFDLEQKKIGTLEKQLKEARDGTAKVEAELAEWKAKVEEAVEGEEMIGSTTPTSAIAKTDAAADKPAKRMFNFKGMFKGAAGEMAANQSITMMYGDLLKEMALSPEEKQQLRKILVESQTQLLQSLGDTDDPTQQAQRVADLQKVSDAKIKQLLGDDRFGQYESYKKQLPDRMQINSFEQSLSMTSNPLSADQKKQMVDIMSNEREKYTSEMAATGSASRASKNPADIMQALNGRVTNRLGTVLKPEQLKEFVKWQESVTQMVRNMGADGAASK